MEQLNSWGIKSHVGTDSEVISRLLDHLVRVEGLSLIEAATVLTNPFERNLLPSSRINGLLVKYGGCRLDGPFAVVAGYTIGDDTYLLALTDRSKFRPLLIGEDEFYYYIASEENQDQELIKECYSLDTGPGSFFIASVEKGILSKATTRNTLMQETVLKRELDSAVKTEEADHFDATAKSFGEINDFIRASFDKNLGQVRVTNVSGQRYIGIGLSITNQQSTRRSLNHFKLQ